MTATAHALVGGAIAASVPNPALGISLSFISHPFLDMIPHWDAGWGWRLKTKRRLFLEGTFDMVFGFLVTYILFGGMTNFWYLSACIFASVVFDIAEIPYWFWKWDFPPFNWIYKIQSRLQGKAKLPWGILTQIVTVAIVIFVLQNVRV